MKIFDQYLEIKTNAKKTVCEAAYYQKLRHITPFFTIIFLKLKLRPNQISVLGMLIWVVGCICFSLGNIYYNLLAILFLHLGAILDCVDGELARYLKKSSLDGWYVDLLMHRLMEPALLIGLTFSVYARHQNPFVFLIGFILVVMHGTMTIDVRNDVVLIGLAEKIKDRLTNEGQRGQVPIKREPSQLKRIVKGIIYPFLDITAMMNALTIIVLLDLFVSRLGFSLVDVFYLFIALSIPMVKGYILIKDSLIGVQPDLNMKSDEIINVLGGKR
jgi:phosphatidylglycerophosphate synthase